jgi:hypothetical protein
MEELKSVLESSPTASPVHPDPRAHDMGKFNIIYVKCRSEDDCGTV